MWGDRKVDFEMLQEVSQHMTPLLSALPSPPTQHPNHVNVETYGEHRLKGIEYWLRPLMLRSHHAELKLLKSVNDCF